MGKSKSRRNKRGGWPWSSDAPVASSAPVAPVASSAPAYPVNSSAPASPAAPADSSSGLGSYFSSSSTSANPEDEKKSWSLFGGRMYGAPVLSDLRNAAEVNVTNGGRRRRRTIRRKTRRRRNKSVRRHRRKH